MAEYLSILGGGPAGLAVAFYARKSDWPFTLYEATPQTGGNARTLQFRNFRYDTGAHRFHDKFEDITQDICELMGNDLRKIHVPSQIYYHGKFVDFPLSPLNLMRAIGLGTCVRAAFEILGGRFGKKKQAEDFETFAIQTYGRVLANFFLLNYSEKLWGRPCSQLSPVISGKRLKGLDLKTFLKELFKGSKAKTEHLDGGFYYPEQGIGQISERLVEFCGEENICCQSRISKIFHEGRKITGIEINQKETAAVERVVSTLPLPLLVKLMEPALPASVLEVAGSLAFRHLILVGIYLNKDSVSPNASVYFPDPEFIFSRVYEPRNRSLAMSPAGQTSLLAEIPCSLGDAVWNLKDEEIQKLVSSQLQKTGWFKEHDVAGATVDRFPYAYPVLEKGIEEKINALYEALSGFENLTLAGRNGLFRYIHIHDLLKSGKELMRGLQCSDVLVSTT